MKAKFDYILYKANGEKQVIARGVERKKWEELKDILGARTLEIINDDYVDPTLEDEIEIKRCVYYMDEEARLEEETNIRNPFFKVIRVGEKEQNERKQMSEMFGFDMITAGVPIVNGVEEWDIVGDVLMEKRNG